MFCSYPAIPIHEDEQQSVRHRRAVSAAAAKTSTTASLACAARAYIARFRSRADVLVFALPVCRVVSTMRDAVEFGVPQLYLMV